MNKYISKAIIYKNLPNTIALGGLLFCVLFTNIMEYYYNTKVSYYSLLKISYVLPILFVIAFASDLYSKKHDNYSYLLTTPIKKSTIIITNLLIPVISIAAAILLYGFISTIILTLGGHLSVSLTTLWYKLFLLFSILLLVNSFIQTFQLIINNSIAGALIPATYVFILIPFIITVTFNSLSTFFPILSNTSLIDIMSNIMRNFGFVKYSDTLYNYSSELIQGFLPIALFIIVALILSIISININKQIKIENLKKAFSFKWFENLFITISSIFISLIVVSIVSYNILKIGFLNISSKPLLLLWYAITIILSYIVYKIFYMLWKKATL